MKLPTLLLATLAAVSVHAENYFGVLYCHARIMEDNGPYLSVELPTTPGYTDQYGNPVAVWKIGIVARGGAIDTFYSENGPGAFQVRNTGNRNAYIYVTSGNPYDFEGFEDSSYRNGSFFESTLQQLFGDGGWLNCSPDPSRRWDYSYALAVSTEMTARVPTWRNLEWMYRGESYFGYVDTDGGGEGETDSDGWINAGKASEWLGPGLCGQYLGFLAAGEVQPFDLKFFAPDQTDGNCSFIVRIEASTFRRWEHDK